jgi:pimeloyl-ACP methyl ester carboxylesterase
MAQPDNVLFLNNGKNEWYQRGIPEFSDSPQGSALAIEKVAKSVGANEIITFGVSMGAYGALLFASMLDSRAMALGFDSVLRHELSRSAKRMPASVPANYPSVRDFIEKSSAKVTAITGDMDFSDLLSMNRIHDLPNVRALTLRGVAHGVGRHIDKYYGLPGVIAKFAEKDELPEFEEVGSVHADEGLVRSIFRSHRRATREDWTGSMIHAGRALAKDDTSEPAHFLMGLSLLKVKEPKKAVTHLTIVRKSVPRFQPAMFNLAKALRMSGQLDEAEESFKDYLALRPDSAGAHHHLSLIYERKSRYMEATANAEQAINLDPDVLSYHKALARIKTRVQR